jgi:hypothetical protein
MRPEPILTWRALPSEGPRKSAAAAAVVALAALAVAFALPTLGRAGGLSMSVIVRESSRATSAPERAVAQLGGRVVRRLPIIDGFEATIPTAGLAHLRLTPGVESVRRNRNLHSPSSN